jgi:alanyl-tRNA synthetase
LRTLAQALLEQEHAVFVGSTAEGQLVVAASEDSGRDAGKLLKEALAIAGGKGGGSPRLAQGSPAPGKLPDAVRFIRDALAPGR